MHLLRFVVVFQQLPFSLQLRLDRPIRQHLLWMAIQLMHRPMSCGLLLLSLVRVEDQHLNPKGQPCLQDDPRHSLTRILNQPDNQTAASQCSDSSTITALLARIHKVEKVYQDFQMELKKIATTSAEQYADVTERLRSGHPQ